MTPLMVSRPSIGSAQGKMAATLLLISVAALIGGGMASQYVNGYVMTTVTNIESTFSTASANIVTLTNGAYVQTGTDFRIASNAFQYMVSDFVVLPIFISVSIYVVAAVFPGAIYQISAANETGWSTTAKSLWNNLMPLLSIVAALMIPLLWIIFPSSREVY